MTPDIICVEPYRLAATQSEASSYIQSVMG